jgi:DNA-binding transcriptional ArsR family regulator
LGAVPGNVESPGQRPASGDGRAELTNVFFKYILAVVTVDVLRDTERLRGTMTPLRRRVLEALHEPASATGLAARLGETRQRVNYHLRELEKGGLVELVELRQRRGRVERVMRPTAKTVIVAPAMIGELDATSQDRFAADTLLAASARTFDDVARMREGAAKAGKRLITFTIEADVGFERPADITRFADQLAELIAAFDTPTSRRRYRVLFCAHPAAHRSEQPT